MQSILRKWWFLQVGLIFLFESFSTSWYNIFQIWIFSLAHNNWKMSLVILEHSSLCSSSSCNLLKCSYMRQLSNHFASCLKFPCAICTDMTCLTQEHAEKCINDNCSVVKCSTLKWDHITLLILLLHLVIDLRTLQQAYLAITKPVEQKEVSHIFLQFRQLYSNCATAYKRPRWRADFQVLFSYQQKNVFP